MSEEKEKVLEMVADGTITASEGARLLEALGSEGYREKKQRAAGKRRITKTRTMISEIGPVIQATMGDVFKSRKSFNTYENMTFEEVESVSEEVEDRQELVIHGEGGRGKSLSVVLSRSEDEILRASLDNDSCIRTGSKDDKRILLWKSGELCVQVPDKLSFVKVFSKGGGISSAGVRVPVELKTMGGGIKISNPGDSFSIKTMGGGLDISLDSTWKGNSKAKTMGGGISIRLTDDIPAFINATTLGGSISIEGNEPKIISDSGKGHGKSKMSVQYGSDENCPELTVTSMGGGIVIEGKPDE